MVNLRLVLSTVVFSSVLMGCQGQNPFKRESDPTKKYPNAVSQGTKPYVPGQKAAAPGGTAGEQGLGGEGIAQTKTCFEPIKIQVKPDTGTSTLKFAEEVESTYKLELTINGANNGELLADQPRDSKFKLAERAENVYVYKFTWKPAKGQSSQKSEVLTVGFPGEVAKGACPGSKNRITFELPVSKNNDAPKVTFQSVKEKISFGEEFQFSVIVEDPKAVKGKFPVIKSVTYDEAKGSKVLDGSEAVIKCQEGRQLDEKKFEFICSFDSNLIKDVEKLLNSGAERTVGFQINAVSTASSLASLPAGKKLNVLFEKIELKSVPLPPPRPKDLAVQGAKK